MSEEGRDRTEAPAGQPRVVKKIVKKTVVRPAAPGGQAARPQTAPRPAPKATAVSRLGRRDRPAGSAVDDAGGDTIVRPEGDESRVSGPRTTLDVGAKASAARDRAVWVAQDGAELARRGAGALRDRAEDAFWAVREWRVPAIHSVPASALTGLLVGLLTTFGGWLCLLLFSALRGTSAGGGWGLLAVVLVVVAAAELGTRLLASFGVEQARAAVALSVMVVAVVVMLVFLETVDGPWAWLVVPGLSVVTLPLVQQLLAWSTSEPADTPPADVDAKA